MPFKGWGCSTHIFTQYSISFHRLSTHPSVNYHHQLQQEHLIQNGVNSHTSTVFTWYWKRQRSNVRGSIFFIFTFVITLSEGLQYLWKPIVNFLIDWQHDIFNDHWPLLSNDFCESLAIRTININCENGLGWRCKFIEWQCIGICSELESTIMKGEYFHGLLTHREVAHLLVNNGDFLIRQTYRNNFVSTRVVFVYL